MPPQQTFIAHIRDLIAKDDFPTAIRELSGLLQNSPRLDEAIQQSARYNDVQKQIRLGTVDFQSANAAKNQTRFAVLELLSEIEEQEQKPDIQEEVERYTMKIEKNVVKNSTITAGRDVQIGDRNYTESQTSRRVRLFLFVFVPVLAIAAAIFYIQKEHLGTPLSLTVRVVDKTPNPNIPLEKAKVALTYGDKTETQETVHEEATFKDIPANYKGKVVNVDVEAEGFEKATQFFTLSENSLTIPVNRDNSLATISGFIKDENGNPASGAQASVQDVVATSDASGFYQLHIPFEKQRKTQRLKAFKPGFKIWDQETPVIKDEELYVILKK